jgi:hypothetical protein
MRTSPILPWPRSTVCAKCRQISVQLVMLADLYVRVVSGGFRATMHRVMLGSRYYAVVLGIFSLHSRDEGNAHSRREERSSP